MIGQDSDEPINPTRTAEIEQLESHVQSGLNGQVMNFHLVLLGTGLVLQGHARTYYAKQLAQHAVLQAIDLPIAANEIEVF